MFLKTVLPLTNDPKRVPHREYREPLHIQCSDVAWKALKTEHEKGTISPFYLILIKSKKKKKNPNPGRPHPPKSFRTHWKRKKPGSLRDDHVHLMLDRLLPPIAPGLR